MNDCPVCGNNFYSSKHAALNSGVPGGWLCKEVDGVLYDYSDCLGKTIRRLANISGSTWMIVEGK